MNLAQVKLSSKNEIILITLFHAFVIVLAYFLFHHLGPDYPNPGDKNIIQFDAYFYDSIRKTGYEYVPGVGNNLAFFPLFPLFWKWTGLSPIMISALNYLIFSVSFIQLLRPEKLHYTTLLLLISLPSFIFFALPYSESLFFLFCTFIVVGYKKQSNYWLYIGLFGASMVRSVCLVFIPAILICELLSCNNANKSVLERCIETCFRLVSALAGLLFAMIYVAQKTGTWFYFIEIQKYWHREWLMIKLPLTTISPERVLGLDGITFVLGLLAVGITSVCFFKALFNLYRRNFNVDLQIDQGTLFSALYIAGMTILDTFFTTYYKQETNIWSLNRHVICTPFAVIFLIFLLRDFKPAKYVKGLICLMLLASIYITGVFQYINIQVLLFFLLFIFTFISLKYFPYGKRYFILYYFVAIYLQITFFRDYLLGGWLG